MTSLTHRLLTRPEAVLLHHEIKTTPNILGYTVRELLRARDVLVAEAEEGTLAGMCLSKDLLFGWTELAVLYVLPAYRGQGIGARLFAAAFDRAERRGRHVYALSRNSQVVRLMERRGMTVNGRLWRAPLAVHLHSQVYMSNWYRLREMFRKIPLMKDCPPLVQGWKRRTP